MPYPPPPPNNAVQPPPSKPKPQRSNKHIADQLNDPIRNLENYIHKEQLRGTHSFIYFGVTTALNRLIKLRRELSE